ncbi:hypothetical protein HK405_003054, partial [Cladochytrium tenue]
MAQIFQKILHRVPADVRDTLEAFFVAMTSESEKAISLANLKANVQVDLAKGRVDLANSRADTAKARAEKSEQLVRVYEEMNRKLQGERLSFEAQLLQVEGQLTGRFIIVLELEIAKMINMAYGDLSHDIHWLTGSHVTAGFASEQLKQILQKVRQRLPIDIQDTLEAVFVAMTSESEKAVDKANSRAETANVRAEKSEQLVRESNFRAERSEQLVRVYQEMNKKLFGERLSVEAQLLQVEGRLTGRFIIEEYEGQKFVNVNEYNNCTKAWQIHLQQIRGSPVYLALKSCLGESSYANVTEEVLELEIAKMISMAFGNLSQNMHWKTGSNVFVLPIRTPTQAVYILKALNNDMGMGFK